MVHPRIFFANVEIDGQRYDILCKNDCLFSKLIVLSTSTSKISSVFSLLYISFIEWIAASIPASYPTQIFTGLGVFITCSFNRETMTLPVIRFKTSRTSNGLLIPVRSINRLNLNFPQNGHDISKRKSYLYSR